MKDWLKDELCEPAGTLKLAGALSVSDQSKAKVAQKRLRDDSPAAANGNGSDGSKEERTLAANMVLRKLEKSRGDLIKDMSDLSRGLIRLAYTPMSSGSGRSLMRGSFSIDRSSLLMRAKNLASVPIPTWNIEVQIFSPIFQLVKWWRLLWLAGQEFGSQFPTKFQFTQELECAVCH